MPWLAWGFAGVVCAAGLAGTGWHGDKKLPDSDVTALSEAGDCHRVTAATRNSVLGQNEKYVLIKAP